MLRILGIVFLVILGFVAVGMFFGIRGSAEERDLARTFMQHVSDRDYAAMRSMMHPELADMFPEGSLASSLENVAVYSDVSFSSFSASTGGTSVAGTAKTEDGCESPITFTFVKNQIIEFNIATICEDPNRPVQEQDA